MVKSETQAEMLAYAIRVLAATEQDVWKLAADLDDVVDRDATNIAIHLSRVLRRLRKLKVIQE